MAISTKKKRVLAVLHLPRKVPAIIELAASVVRAMKDSKYFPDPTPPLDDVRIATYELRRAQWHARLRTLGAVEARDEKLVTLVGLLELVRAHVQGVADLDPTQGPAIIRSAGLRLQKEQEREPVRFHAKLGEEPGTVRIFAPAAARRASYDWEYSLDRGRTWKAMPATLQSRTSLSGVPGQTIVELRYRATTKAGMGAWSEAIGIFVP